MRLIDLPLISVCIPVYNGENYIKESIESVLKQTERNFELLVIDNCSTDKTLNIVNSFNDPRINVFQNKSNLGSIRNFNKCIELAQGEYFILLPHDDLLLPTALEIFSKVLISNPQIGLSYSSRYTINKEGERINLVMVAHQDKTMNSEEALKEFIVHRNPVQCAMVPKKIILSLGGFDPKMIIYSDVDLWSKIAISGYFVSYIHSPQFCNRTWPDQGQNLFKSNSKKNLDKIKQHLVGSIDDSFSIDNHYNNLLFKFLKVLFTRIGSSLHIQNLKVYSIDWIITSQLSSTFRFIKEKNLSEVRKEFELFKNVLKWGGLITVFTRCFVSFFKLIKRKVFKKSTMGIHQV